MFWSRSQNVNLPCCEAYWWKKSCSPQFSSSSSFSVFSRQIRRAGHQGLQKIIVFSFKLQLWHSPSPITGGPVPPREGPAGGNCGGNLGTCWWPPPPPTPAPLPSSTSSVNLRRSRCASPWGPPGGRFGGGPAKLGGGPDMPPIWTTIAKLNACAFANCRDRVWKWPCLGARFGWSATQVSIVQAG